MIRTIFFDMGGTLDGAGHWLERFLLLYRREGISLPRAEIRAAFDAAEKKAAVDEAMAQSGFEEMVRRHVRWQLEHLRLTSGTLENSLVENFTAATRTAVRENAALLRDLHARGFTLGVISNGCGNVAQLCAEFGYAPFLSLLLDSRRLGFSKPDPAIYRCALERSEGEAATMLMVGDSFARDIVPAKKVGMQTAWLSNEQCPDATVVDFRLQRLADLPALLP